MKALIVEDSELARLDLKAMLKEHEDIDIVGEAAHPDEAEIMINKYQPDLLFLDIHMPGRSGFELLDSIKQKTKVIFTTAHIDFAIRSFDYDPVDYLVKPISPKKLARAIGRLKEYCNVQGEEIKPVNPELTMEESIFVRDGENCFFIPLRNIERFDSHGNYCRIYFEDAADNTQKSVFLYKSLAKVEARLPARHFFRNNRQQIINVSSVMGVEVWVNGGLRVKLKSGVDTDVSRRNASKFKQIFSI